MATVPIFTRAVADDGAVTEHKPTFDEFMREYDAAIARAEARRARHEITATDLGVTTDHLRESKRAERMRAERALLDKHGSYEGPTARFEILLGGSHPWDGPGSHMVEFADGGKRCRGCSHLERLAPSMYCLHCSRSGLDHIKGIKGTRPKPCDPKPETPIVGPLTRRQKRAVRV